MANESTILVIDNEDKTEAQFMSRNFVDKEVKNRVYLNALGAELVLKYLKSQGIEVSNIHNLHSISKIIEMMDISDILLPNIHIDVRVVFDKNQIFVPKSHFDLGITPDIYVVLKLDKNDFSHLDLLGYFSPSVINTENKNENYYFVEPDKIISASTLVAYIKNYSGNTSKGISDSELLQGRSLSISLADHDIKITQVKELLSLLLASDTLRESVLEFDNFETLSYNVAPTIQNENVVENVVQELDEDSEEQPEVQDISSLEDIKDDELEEPEDISDVKEFEDVSEPEVIAADELKVEDVVGQDIVSDEENMLLPEENIELEQEESLPDLDIKIDDLDTVHDIEPAENLKPHNSDLGKAIVEGLAIAGTAAGAGAVAASGAAAAEGIAAAAATDGAINLAGIAGDIVNDLKNITSESNTQDLKDLPETLPEVPVNKEEEKSQDEFHAPKDLSEFEKVEKVDTEENIVAEAVNFGDMDAVENLDKEIEENMDHLTDLSENEKVEDVSKQEELLEDIDNSEDIVGETLEELNLNEDEQVELQSVDESEIEKNESEDVIELSEKEEIIQTHDDEIADEVVDDELQIIDDDSEVEPEEESKYTSMEDLLPEKSQETSVPEDDSEYDDLFDIQDFIEAQEKETNSNAENGEVVGTQNDSSAKVLENSVVISDKDFTPGEIEIDINKPEEQNLEGSEHLKNLYNNKDKAIPGASLLNGPNLLNKPSKGRGLGLLGIITSLIILGIIGFSVSKMLKKPQAESPQPITDNTSSSEHPDNISGLKVNEGNVVNMDKVSPISPAAVQHKNETKPQVAAKSSKSLSATQFISVRKLSWEVPSHVSASKTFMQYFQSAGKSLKLSLTSDLLLATDYVYSDQVRVSVNYNQDGSFRDAKILLSSGSPQVDRIVLQTVNQTLKVLKAPHSVGNDSATTVILKIYF